MSSHLPEISSAAKLPDAGKSKSKSSLAKIHPTSQARHGYLGHLSLKDSQESGESLRTVSALDAISFLPNVMTLQRASTPWQYNTPVRALEEPMINGGEVGPHSLTSSASKKALSTAQPLPVNYVRRIRRRAQNARHEPADYRQALADLKLLADAATRAGNIYQALQAFHKMGVVLDNQGMYAEATVKYKQFLSLCITSKNAQGEALAYNCLGINSFKLGHFDDAIQYHNKHLELADSTGRLIAHTNLGIVFQAMGLAEHAAIHHQHAIEYANRMGAKDAQCFTVGNLGIASVAQGDLQTSRICLQYHLSAAEKQKHILGDSKFALQTYQDVANTAHARLGQVNTTDGRLEEAASHFEKAMEVAKSKGDQTSEERSGAMLGVAMGLLAFEQHRAALLGQAHEESRHEL